MLLIHIPRLTNRLGYTLNVVFNHILHIEYSLTTDADLFLAHRGPRLGYGPECVGEGLYLKSTRLLFETSIREQEPHPFEQEGQWMLFPVYGRDLALPFDPLAATFFMVSRYEEYLPHLEDAHNRFPASASLAATHGFLDQPVVDQWAYMIRHALVKHYPNEDWPRRTYRFVQTVDIDAAWSYKHKGFARTLAGIARDLVLKRDPLAVAERMQVLLGKQPDPYDNFDYIIEHHNQKQANTHLLFFVLLADYDDLDKPIPYLNPHLRELLLHISDHAHTGIHPGYYSLDHPAQTDIEIQRLGSIIHRHIVRSRYHYLRLKLPLSYRILLHAGIQHDYTMGFPETVGFRAGTTDAFPFFDLGRNVETSLIVHPHCVMDTTLCLHLGLSPDEALRQYQTLIQRIREVDGTFCCIVHQQNLCEQKQWQGWRRVYEQMLLMAQP